MSCVVSASVYIILWLRQYKYIISYANVVLYRYGTTMRCRCCLLGSITSLSIHSNIGSDYVVRLFGTVCVLRPLRPAYGLTNALAHAPAKYIVSKQYFIHSSPQSSKSKWWCLWLLFFSLSLSLFSALVLKTSKRLMTPAPNMSIQVWLLVHRFHLRAVTSNCLH